MCVCVCVRTGSIYNITYLKSKRDADWQSKCQMVFIRSPLYKTVFKSPHLKTGLTCPSTSILEAFFRNRIKVPTSPRHTHQWYLLNLNAGKNDKTWQNKCQGQSGWRIGIGLLFGVPVIHSPLGYVLIQGCLYKVSEVFNINDSLVQGIGNDLDWTTRLGVENTVTLSI